MTVGVVVSERTTSQGGSRAAGKIPESSLCDSPRQYDVTEDDEKRKTVISVPTFKPPPDPIRNDKDHPMSSEPVYDLSR